MEIWRDVIGYEGYYQVSNLGRIKSLDRTLDKSNFLTGGPVVRKGRLRKLVLSNTGYLRVNLCVHDKRKLHSVHRLVVQAFLTNTYNEPAINHKNGLKTDNRLYNLEWSNPSKNGVHSYEHGLSKVVNRKPIICVELNKKFTSSYEAAEWLNNTKFGNTRKVPALSGKIRLCANKQRRIAFGYRWEFVD